MWCFVVYWSVACIRSTSSEALLPLSSLPSLLSSLLYSLSSVLIPCANLLLCLPSAALLCVYIALLCLYAPPWRSWSRAQQRHASLATKTRLPLPLSLPRPRARSLSLAISLCLPPYLSHIITHTLCAHTLSIFLFLPSSPLPPSPPLLLNARIHTPGAGGKRGIECGA